MSIHIRSVTTSDDLKLIGIEYQPTQKQSCVLFIPGMSANFMENYFSQVIGETLVEQGVGFIFAHNRGYNHINDIATSDLDEHGGFKSVRIGATYEIFTDCVQDIRAWVQACRELGYQKIILMGHSLGVSKLLYYLSQENLPELSGLILTSPADMVGLISKPEYQKNTTELFAEARANVEQGQPRKLLGTQIWNWYTLSSQTFLSLFEENGPVDMLPLHRPGAAFDQLARISVPILAIMGEFDDIAITSLTNDMNTLQARATGTPSFTAKFIAGANHGYDGQEKSLAEVINNWVQSLV